MRHGRTLHTTPALFAARGVSPSTENTGELCPSARLQGGENAGREAFGNMAFLPNKKDRAAPVLLSAPPVYGQNSTSS